MEKKQIAALLVDDSFSDAHLLRASLDGDMLAVFHLTQVETLAGALDALSTQSFDVALLDLSLLDCPGMQALMRIRQAAPSLPVVVLLATEDESLVIQSLQEGAQDYLVKRPQEYAVAGRVVRYVMERQLSVRQDLTERQDAEKALSQVQKRLQTIFENTPLPMGISRLSDGVFTDINLAFTRLLGYTKGEVVGHTVSELNLWWDYADYQAITDRLSQGHRLEGFETALRAKLGEKCAAIASGELIEINDEPSVLLQITDITDRKRAELETQQSIARFHQIADNITDIFWITDPHTMKNIYVSPAFEKIMGLSAVSVAQLPNGYLDMLHPEDRQILINARAHEEGGFKTNCQYRIVRPDGAIRWINDKGTPVFGEDGTVKLVVGIASDITEQVASENRVKESEERFRQLADGIQEIFWLFDSVEQRLLYISPAYETISGRSVQDLYANNMGYVEAIHPDDRERVLHAMKAQATGSLTEIEYRMVRPDGEIRWLRDRAFPIFDEAEKLVRTAGIAADITERKKAENDLLQRQQLLEKVIRLGKNVAAITDLDQCLLRIYDSVKHELGFDRVGIFLYDPERNELSGTFGTDRTGEMMDNSAYRCSAAEWTDWERVMQNPNGLAYEQDYQAARAVSPENEMYGVKQHISLAAWAGDKPLALIAVDNLSSDRHITIADVEALQLFAGYAGLAITNARLHTGLARRVQELKQADENAMGRQRLLELVILLGKNVTATTDLERCLREIYNSVRFGLGFERVGLFLYDKFTGFVRGAYGTSPTGEIVMPWFFEGPVTSWGGWEKAMESPAGMFFLEDYQAHFNPPEDSEMYGVKQHVTIAAWAGEKPLALITAHNLTTGKKIQPVDLEALQLFAGYAGLAIENATLHTGLERRLDELNRADEDAAYRQKLLEQVIILGKRISSITDLQACLREVHRSIQHGLKFDRVGLFLYDHETQMAQGAYGTDKDGQMVDTTWYTTQIADWWIWDEALKSPRGISMIEDYQVIGNPPPDSDMYGVKQYATLAAWVGDKPVAMIAVDNLVSQRVMNKADLEALQFFAGYVGLAIENARLNAGLEQRVKERTAELRASQASLQNFLDTASDLIQSLDEKGNYLYVNAAWRQTLGYTAEEALNLTLFDVVDPGYHAYCKEILIGQTPDQRHQQVEVVFKTKDGRDVVVEGRVGSRQENDHVVTNGIFRDITLRKQAEQALRESEAKLRSSRDKLSAANISLARAARMKDEFLASMSHELRTPLTGILGIAEALQYNTYGSLTEKQARALKMVEESGRHLLELINDILDLSKIEAGMLELNVAPVNIGDICQASLQLIKGMANKKHQMVHFSANLQGVTVRGDARRLKQILVNLLSNAIKFTPEGGALGLEVAASKPEHAVRLTVWDTGIGIAPEHLERLFLPFVQLESSLARQYEGTGLGLSLVQKLVDMHGGSIQVESEPGKGSRFCILLPWSDEWTRPVPGLMMDARVLRKALVVDDSEIEIEQYARYLRMLGLEVVAHSAGQGIVELAARENPGVILLGLEMPDAHGSDILTALKADARTQSIPVLVCSVLENDPQVIEWGASGFLRKPLTMGGLRSALNRIMMAVTQDVDHLRASGFSIQPLVLVVDDNEVIVEAISDFLAAQKFRVEYVRSGIELLTVAPSLNPDIILIDIQMPGMDGLEATRRLRANPQFTQTPIIALTALAMSGDRERCLEAGANEYMSKPVRLKELVAMIRNLL